jgi:hypothetical protein
MVTAAHPLQQDVALRGRGVECWHSVRGGVRSGPVDRYGRSAVAPWNRRMRGKFEQPELPPGLVNSVWTSRSFCLAMGVGGNGPPSGKMAA